METLAILKILVVNVLLLNLFLVFVNAQVTSFGPPNAPMGLFLSLGARARPEDAAAFVPQLKTMLNYVCQYHRDPLGPRQYINDFVLLDTSFPDDKIDTFVYPPSASTNDTLLWTLIEPMLPYFPGGNGPCQFDRVFVGTFGLPSGNVHDYIDAVANGTFRSHLLARQKAAAQKFTAKVATSTNPNVKWDWYITQEMCLDYVNFDYYEQAAGKKITEGWADYLSRAAVDFNSIRPNRQFLASPMFDNVKRYYPQISLDFIQERLGWMFRTVASNLATSLPSLCGTTLNCPFIVAPQDHVGLASPSSVKNYTKEDTVAWMDLLKAVYPFRNLTINTEQFIYNTLPAPSSYHDADCEEVKIREQFYVSKGYKLGPAYEMPMWYKCNHPGAQRTCETGWTGTTFNEYCYKKFPWAKKWQEANDICVQNGAQLVSIHSKRENDFVVALDNVNSDSIWTGYFNPMVYTYKGFPVEPYMGTENGTILFRWSDGKPRDYWNWTPGWPQNGWPINTSCPTCGANCVAIYPANGGGQWGNAGCDWYAGAFVCKK